MNHLYTNITALYRAFCENLYGPLAFLAVKIKYSLYWNFQFSVSAHGGKETEKQGEKEGENYERLNIFQMRLLSVPWLYRNGSLSVLFLCLHQYGCDL
jgi:hypothetical protein